MLPATRQAMGLLSYNVPVAGYVGNSVITTDLTTYNHTITGGSAGRFTNRIFVVGVSGSRNGGTPSSITSVTVGGNTATRVGTDQTTDAFITGLFRVDGTFGYSSIPIDVVYGQGQKLSGVGLWEVFNLRSPVPITSGGTNTVDPVTASLAIQYQSVVIGVSTNQSGSSTWAWSNTGDDNIEDFDQIMEAAQSFSGAHGRFLTSNRTLTVTADPNPDGTSSRNAANWGVWR